MLLFNSEVNLKWSASFVICETNRKIAFVITDTKLYVPVVTFEVRIQMYSNVQLAEINI